MLNSARTRQAPSIATTALIETAIEDGAHVVFSMSGGKDSAAATDSTMKWLDTIGHPRAHRAAIHADLGYIEWHSTGDIVRQLARQHDLPLDIVRRRTGGLIERWVQRFQNGLARFERLETYALIGPWSSASLRFCTSELKAQVIGASLARRYRGETVISVIGLRRTESAARAKIAIAQEDTRFARPGNAHGTRMLTWNPIAEWSTDAVYDYHARHGLSLHEAYTRYGATRLGCAYCVLASHENLLASTRASQTHDAYRTLVDLECRSAFSFQPNRWLGDVAPHLLIAGQRDALECAKNRAELRRRTEKAMPDGLRFVRGWPPRLPTAGEADAIAEARAIILQDHGLANHYPTGPHVVARFAALMAA